MNRHGLTARWVEGEGMLVTDASGAPIKVSYGATADCCTCYAHTDRGFIGGWQCMPKSAKMKFRDLEAAINAGVLYRTMGDLPTGRRYAKHRRVYSNAAY